MLSYIVSLKTVFGYLSKNKLGEEKEVVMEKGKGDLWLGP